jgi:hypothetical protein
MMKMALFSSGSVLITLPLCISASWVLLFKAVLGLVLGILANDEMMAWLGEWMLPKPLFLHLTTNGDGIFAGKS